MTNEELKKEISKNIQLVFDNEKSFIKSVIKRLDIICINSFYIGKINSLVMVDNGFTSFKYIRIRNIDFFNWKQSLNKDEQ